MHTAYIHAYVHYTCTYIYINHTYIYIYIRQIWQDLAVDGTCRAKSDRASTHLSSFSSDLCSYADVHMYKHWNISCMNNYARAKCCTFLAK